ncbi:MAG: hypothetical protein O7H41_00170 [Planctomycetota bacterium]|nr:hypothetical protein [Planctomycetota bacterium]
MVSSVLKAFIVSGILSLGPLACLDPSDSRRKSGSDERIASLETRISALEEKVGLERPVEQIPDTKRTPAEEVVRGYFQCRTWKDRLQFVWRPEAIKQKMQKRYGTKILGPYTVSKCRSVPAPDSRLEGKGLQFVDAEWRENDPGGARSSYRYVLRDTRQGPRIDWEASTGYNDLTPAMAKAQRIEEPTPIRARAQLSDYYNYYYLGRNSSYYSIHLMSARIFFDYPQGYVPRETDLGRKLWVLLQDGNVHELILKVQYTDRDRTGEQWTIVELVEEGWIEGLGLQGP